MMRLAVPHVDPRIRLSHTCLELKHASGTIRVTHRQRIISASTFLAWYEQLEAIVAEDPHELAPGGSLPAVLMLLELVNIGIRHGALLPIVTHNSGPRGFAHLSFRYSVNPEYDWGGEIALMPESDLDAARVQQLILELETATGVTAQDDEIG